MMCATPWRTLSGMSRNKLQLGKTKHVFLIFFYFLETALAQ